MGCYIKLIGEKVLYYLNRVGQEISINEFIASFMYTYRQKEYPVVYRDNGTFEYGIILYDNNEYRRVMKELPKDCKIFIVPLTDLELVSNIREFIAE